MATKRKEAKKFIIYQTYHSLFLCMCLLSIVKTYYICIHYKAGRAFKKFWFPWVGSQRPSEIISGLLKTWELPSAGHTMAEMSSWSSAFHLFGWRNEARHFAFFCRLVRIKFPTNTAMGMLYLGLWDTKCKSEMCGNTEPRKWQVALVNAPGCVWEKT